MLTIISNGKNSAVTKALEIGHPVDKPQHLVRRQDPQDRGAGAVRAAEEPQPGQQHDREGLKRWGLGQPQGAKSRLQPDFPAVEPEAACPAGGAVRLLQLPPRSWRIDRPQ